MRFYIYAATVVSAALMTTISLAQPETCPNPPVVDISTAQTPADVCVPAGFGGNPIAFFDDYSWRVFIAMVWPASRAQRGASDSGAVLGGSGPRVFETFKADWEVFQPNGGAPSDWNSFAGVNPCGAQTVGFDDLQLASFNRSGNLGQAGAGNLVGPLVAQNTTYTRYLTGFNQIEFGKIAADKLYLQANLHNVTFANGAVDVKSAWVDMKNLPHPERYYTRSALVLNPADGTCATTTVGLVGLHIVQKTLTRPQWIWSSFEHVDTVPPAKPGAPGTFVFNNGSPTAMPAENPFPLDPLTLPTPAPFNVQRIRPIHPSTQATNLVYQQALANAGSIWRFYELVMTQWPLQPNMPQLPGTIANTFPGSGGGSDATVFANTTMETFDQERVRTGCMACHTLTKQDSDFVWSLAVNAFAPPTPSMTVTGSRAGRKSVEELKRLLQSTHPAKRKRK
jgi:hypothetical protein